MPATPSPPGAPPVHPNIFNPSTTCPGSSSTYLQSFSSVSWKLYECIETDRDRDRDRDNPLYRYRYYIYYIHILTGDCSMRNRWSVRARPVRAASKQKSAWRSGDNFPNQKGRVLTSPTLEWPKLVSVMKEKFHWSTRCWTTLQHNEWR